MRPNTWQCKRFEWRSETSRPDNWQISVRPPETKICIEPREDQFTARQNQRLFGPGKISTRSWQIQNPTLYKKSTKQQISYLTVLSPPPPKKVEDEKRNTADLRSSPTGVPGSSGRGGARGGGCWSPSCPPSRRMGLSRPGCPNHSNTTAGWVNHTAIV